MGLVLLLLLACFTTNKLIKMAKIRGFIPGPAPEVKIVTGKIASRDRDRAVFWLAWDNADIHVPGRNRINLSKEVWQSFNVGDSIEILYFPGDRWPYTRRDIFADDGNFAFDEILLTLWVAGIVTLATFQIRDFLRARKRDHGPYPSIYYR